MTDPESAPSTDSNELVFLGPRLFNRTWELLDKDDRTAAEDDEMIHTAHASAYHWLSIGLPVNFARSHWQCSRVYAVLGHVEAAKYHAARVLAICESNDIADFDLAFAYEALARACGVGGEEAAAKRWADLARKAAAEVEDEDDRNLVLADIATLPIS